jgi:hypothetical protein
MAQTRGRAFDIVLRDKREICLQRLREAADYWAANRAPPLEVRAVLAVLLHILSADWDLWALSQNQRDQQVRPLSDWIPLVGAPERACSRFFKRTDRRRDRKLTEQLLAELTSASEAWKQGYPEAPETQSVIREIMDILFRAGALHWINR